MQQAQQAKSESGKEDKQSCSVDVRISGQSSSVIASQCFHLRLFLSKLRQSNNEEEDDNNPDWKLTAGSFWFSRIEDGVAPEAGSGRFTPIAVQLVAMAITPDHEMIPPQRTLDQSAIDLSFNDIYLDCDVLHVFTRQNECTDMQVGSSP
jgi:hypothetical protein